MSDAPRETLQPEVIVRMMSSPNLVTSERLSLATELNEALARDPDFLASVKRVLSGHGRELAEVAPDPQELASFGWAEAAPEVRPRQAAAAAAAGVAATLVPLPV